MPVSLADACMMQGYMHAHRYHKHFLQWCHTCRGVTQNGSGSSSMTSPTFVLVEMSNKSMCRGTEVSVKMNGLLSRITLAKGLVPLHLYLHPYHNFCWNCARIFKLHGRIITGHHILSNFLYSLESLVNKKIKYKEMSLKEVV